MGEFILDLYSDKGRIDFEPYGLDTEAKGECYYCKEPEFIEFYFTLPSGRIDTSKSPDQFCAKCFMARAGLYLLRCYTLVMAISETPLWLQHFHVEPATAKVYGTILRSATPVKDIDEIKEFLLSCVGAVGGTEFMLRPKRHRVNFIATI